MLSDIILDDDCFLQMKEALERLRHMQSEMIEVRACVESLVEMILEASKRERRIQENLGEQ